MSGKGIPGGTASFVCTNIPSRQLDDFVELAVVAEAREDFVKGGAREPNERCDHAHSVPTNLPAVGLERSRASIACAHLEIAG